MLETDPSFRLILYWKRTGLATLAEKMYTGAEEQKKPSRNFLTAPQYLYRIIFRSHDIPSFASRVTSREGMHMDIHHILSELQAEPARLDRVITALEGLFSWLCPTPWPPCKALFLALLRITIHNHSRCRSQNDPVSSSPMLTAMEQTLLNSSGQT